jgi:hypothetical protein
LYVKWNIPHDFDHSASDFWADFPDILPGDDLLNSRLKLDPRTLPLSGKSDSEWRSVVGIMQL